MIEPAHLVGTGGAIGAVLRYSVGRLVDDDRVPVSTLAVNVAGSFVLGLVAFAPLDGDLVLFVGTGACGSFTTYSSFSVETVRLWERGDRLRAGGYALATLGLCLLAAGAGAGVVALLGS